MFENILFLAGGVMIGATWYKVIRPTVRAWSGGKIFADGVGAPPAPDVGGLKAVKAAQDKAA